MKTIPLQGSDKVALVDDCWYDALLKVGPWYINEKGEVSNKGWAKMHHLVIGIQKGEEVDHKDGNRLNNQECNLRKCTRSQNMANTGKRSCNTSGYKGVTWHEQQQKWRAYIKVNYKQISLGLHLSKEDAARAYDKAAKHHFGEFAQLNFPESVL